MHASSPTSEGALGSFGFRDRQVEVAIVSLLVCHNSRPLQGLVMVVKILVT